MPSPTVNSPSRLPKPPPLPRRPRDGHKGLFGRVLIVGGSEDMIGAPVLAGGAALRMGSGLVQVAMPVATLAMGLSVFPELIGLGLHDDLDPLLEAAEKADVLAVGPGMGQGRDAARRVDALIKLDKAMVLDADALNHLAAGKAWPKDFQAHAVLTPHPGEMKRLGKLFGCDDVPGDERGRIKVAVDAARAFGQVIVLKGHRTIVTDAKQLYVNDTGDSSLSKAGAGDVLTGIIASLIGQKMSPFDAACRGVWLHGRAGELAGRRLGLRGVLARDVIAMIPRAGGLSGK